MKILQSLALVLTFSAVNSQRGSWTGSYTGSFTRTTVPTTTETVYSDYALAVMELIDAGTCADLTVSTNCDTDVTGYFETFEYNGNRVIISSGAPNHAAETDAYLGGTLSNRFLRCERWQYAVVPLNPVKSTTTDWSSYENYPYYTGSNNGMGVYGYAISGGTFFDTRSAAGGATALDNELERLDTCLGHSAPTIYQYHYHATPLCLPDDTWLASDPDECLFIGYMLDGFPIYGKCRHTDGTELESCWTSTEEVPDHLEDYVYGSTASGAACYLDEANGYEFTAGQTSDGYVGYGYVTTEGFSGVPIGLMGDTHAEYCGFTP